MKTRAAVAFFAVIAVSLAISNAARAAGIPPGAGEAKSALAKSPRHGEWVDITVPGWSAPMKSFIVYPESKEKAPVVVVIHEIFGLTDWVRSVADQLAADGFIAISPDLLSAKGGTEALGDRATQVIRTLKPEEVTAGLNAARDYALKQPAANGKSASIGYCWGGGKSFEYATVQPALNAAVVYYGAPPAASALEHINCPVAGFYGGNDARITATVEPTAAQLKKLGKSYSPHVYEGAGHGFLRQQTPPDSPNAKAAQEAWPATIEFIRQNTK